MRETFIPQLSLILGQHAGTQQAAKPQGKCPSGVAGSVHGTEAGHPRKTRTDYRRDFVPLSVLHIRTHVLVRTYVHGIRPSEMKSKDIQGTVRGTPGITHGCHSQGASNLTGEGGVCQMQKTNIKCSRENKVTRGSCDTVSSMSPYQAVSNS